MLRMGEVVEIAPNCRGTTIEVGVELHVLVHAAHGFIAGALAAAGAAARMARGVPHFFSPTHPSLMH